MATVERPRTRARVGALFLTTVVMTLLWSAPAGAQSATGGVDDDQIVLHGELVVQQGETVGTAVIFDGPATVEGTVRESLVVFNGDVEITGTVRRDVVVFNGAVVVRDGAEVRGNLVSQESAEVEPGAGVLGEQRSIASGAELGEIGLASRFAWWLAYSISTLVLGLVLLLVAPRFDPAVGRASRERTGASFGIGLAVFLLLPIVALVLLATLLALPLGVFLLLAIALIYTVGYVAGAHVIGRRLVGEPKSRFLAFLAGWGIVRLLGLVPILGGIVWTLVTVFGLGVIVVAARRAPSQMRVDTPAPPPYPIPAA